MQRRLFVWLTMLSLSLAIAAATARADGDPASDVLATQSLFLAQDAGVSPAQQAQLQALIPEAQRAGVAVRVAVIASAADLGSVTALWRQPQSYARFLGQELAQVWHGRLLVVMPGGVGLFGSGSVPTGLTRSSGGEGLGASALVAVRQLAAASGHPLPLPPAPAPAAAASSGPLPWIVFAIGLALVITAWAASLRARPLRARGQREAPA